MTPAPRIGIGIAQCVGQQGEGDAAFLLFDIGESRGLATALMRAAELDCQSGKLFTSTNQSNVPMQRLCDRLGFVKSGYIENLDEGDPELIYVKMLAPLPGT